MNAVVERIVNREDNRAYYTFSGDLSQMCSIEQALRGAGFNIVRNDVYPGFVEEAKEEYIKALKFIFTNKIDGWWNQEREYIEHRVCTQEEFDRKLGRNVE